MFKPDFHFDQVIRMKCLYCYYLFIRGFSCVPYMPPPPCMVLQLFSTKDIHKNTSFLCARYHCADPRWDIQIHFTNLFHSRSGMHSAAVLLLSFKVCNTFSLYLFNASCSTITKSTNYLLTRAKAVYASFITYKQG